MFLFPQSGIVSMITKQLRSSRLSSYNRFVQFAKEEDVVNTHQQNQDAMSKNQIAPSHVLAGRGYREELYSARIFGTKKGLAPAFKRMNQMLSNSHILQRCKQRRYFVEPYEKRNEITYKGRKRRFDELVRKTIHDIREIHLSRNYDEITSSSSS